MKGRQIIWWLLRATHSLDKTLGLVFDDRRLGLGRGYSLLSLSFRPHRGVEV
jgi:hypothetical protein